MVATCSGDHTARIWDAASGEPVTPPLHHGDAVRKAIFYADSRRVLTLCNDGVARIWDLRQSLPEAGLIPLLAQALTARRAATAVGPAPLHTAAIETAWNRLKSRRGADYTPTKRQIIAWHMQEAMANSDRGAWSLALPHLNALAAATPLDRNICLLRLEAYAELAQWGRVAAEQAKLGAPGAKIVVLAAHERVTAIPRHAPLRIGGSAYGEGVACNSASRLMILLPSPAKQFQAVAAVEKKDDGGGFYARIPSRAQSPSHVWMVSGATAVPVSVPLNGATALILEVKHPGLNTPTAWASTRIELMNGRILSLADLPILAANAL
jgi:hypothetical protein